MCNCMICKHQRGEITDEQFRNYLLETIEHDPDELVIAESKLMLYELDIGHESLATPSYIIEEHYQSYKRP